MTAVQTRAAQAPKPSPAARAHDVLAFEWTKLRSVRSTSITLLIAAVVTIGATAIVAHGVAAAPKYPPGGFSALSVSFLAYAEYTVIPVSVLAALQFTSEYSSGLIRTTTATPPVVLRFCGELEGAWQQRCGAMMLSELLEPDA